MEFLRLLTLVRERCSPKEMAVFDAGFYRRMTAKEAVAYLLKTTGETVTEAAFRSRKSRLHKRLSQLLQQPAPEGSP